MCNGFATGSSGFRARSPGTLLAHRRSVLGFGPLSKVEGKEGAGFDNVNGDSLLFPGRFGDLPDPEGVSRAAGPGGVKGGDQIGVIGPDVKQDTNYAKERPKRAAPSKGKKGSGGGTKQSAKGKGSGAVSSSSQSSSSSSGGASGAGAPGGEPPGGGKGPGKEPPSSAVNVSPKKRPRRSGRRSTGPVEEPDEAVNETADQAAAAMTSAQSSSSTSVSTLKSAKDVKAVTAAARKKAREELKKEAERKAKEAADAAAAAAAASMPPPPPHSMPSAATISKAGTKSVSSAAAVAAAPATPSSYPQYKCGTGCECNSFGREKLREKESTIGPEEHCRENLSFIRWAQLRRDTAELKEAVRENRELLVEQKKILEEILQHSKEAATIRASVDLAADDKGELEMPWVDMDQSVAAFETMAKRQMLYRILERIVCRACHFPRKAMQEMFAPPLQQRVYPLGKPNTHSKRGSTWRYGKKYHYLPQVTLDFIGFVMSKKFTEFTSALAIKEVKDHLNDARETAKDKDKEAFYNHLDEPVYLLVWRDSESKCFVIEESPPFDGDDDAKESFMDRWEDKVNEEIDKKHPNGFIHKDPPNPRA